MTKEPKAMDPRWYLRHHEDARLSVPDPLVSVLHSKYQMQADAPMMNCTQPIMKELIQKRANMW